MNPNFPGAGRGFAPFQPQYPTGNPPFQPQYQMGNPPFQPQYPTGTPPFQPQYQMGNPAFQNPPPMGVSPIPMPQQYPKPGYQFNPTSSSFPYLQNQPPPMNYSPGQVTVMERPASFQVPQAVMQPANPCRFCATGKPSRGETPCHCGYCNIYCAMTYIERNNRGGNIMHVKCQCGQELDVGFLINIFATRDNLERSLRPGQVVQPAAPVPKLPPVQHLCAVCQNNYSEQDGWQLPCSHTYCKPCVINLIKAKVAIKDFDGISCPQDRKLMSLDDIRALVPKDVLIAFYQLVPEKYVVNQGELFYQCPAHPFFRVVSDPGVPSVQCPNCQNPACPKCGNAFLPGHACV